MNKLSLQEEEIAALELQKAATIQEINMERQQLKQEHSFIGQLGKFIEPIINHWVSTGRWVSA